MKRQDSTHSTNLRALPSQWLFYIIAAVGILISLTLWYGLLLHSENHIQHIFQEQTNSLQTDTVIQSELRISALKQMAKHLKKEPTLSEGGLEDNIISFLNNYSEFQIALLEKKLSYVALVLGIFIAILVAIAQRLAQISRHRAKSLDQSNQDLKNEITERLHTEETKLKLEKALLQGQKLQAIGTLAGGIAHDFNNIIYAIIGYAEMAQEDVQKDSLVYKNLGKVLEASLRAKELVSRILSFGRRQQHHDFTPIPLKSTIESVLALLGPTIPASVAINFVADIPETCMIMGNQTQLHQVVVNLINNAVDAMDGEGAVTIHITRILADDAEFTEQFPQLTSHNYCKIDISDTGHGMDQPTIGRIFEPFFTTKEVGKGTGLGLATVHTIVNEHQGNISVASQLGRGTTFTVLLPEYAEEINNG
jgi:signal transduction histidine kinase